MVLTKCDVCPRHCGADRANGSSGFCMVSGDGIYLARAALHFWEEPCISGRNGSGAVFFCGCNLRCIYCQNHSISSMQEAREVSSGRLSEIFLELQEKGAENINLVTPTHYSLQIAAALDRAKEEGLRLPVVYNCGGYESVDTLRYLEGHVDVYLTDYKYEDAALAARFSAAPDYPEVAKAALAEMVRQQPEAVFDGSGMMKRGVIVRHLLLPGHVKNSRAAADYLYGTYGDRIWLSLMSQYTPVIKSEEYPELNRPVTAREYDRFIDYAIGLGVKNAFIQEERPAKESFIPPFDFEGV